MERKNEAKQTELSKADKDTKRKANSFRRDPLTQTNLKNFFKKSSEISNSNTDVSDDETGLVIDENDEESKAQSNFNSNDTTLKVKELEDEAINDDTQSTDDLTESVQLDEYKSRNSTSKTLVINITLKGIPSKDKDSHRKQETPDKNKDTSKEKKHNKDVKSSKEKTTSKRKIKALFGESDSDSEIQVSKKTKVTNNASHHKKQQDRQNNSKEGDDLNVKKRETPVKPSTLFGNVSDSESENELVIDDQCEEVAVNRSAEDTLILSDMKDEQASQDTINSFESKVDSETSVDNNSNRLFDPLQGEADDSNLNKARQLSLEADAVMQKLLMFKDVPPEPAVEILPDVESLIPVTTKSPPSPVSSKLKDNKDKLKNVAKHKLSLSKKVKEEKEKKGASSKKEEHKKPHNNESKHKSKRHSKKSEVTANKAEKVDLASLVVKLLMPYYKKKKISSRDLFKTTARHIVHQLLAIQVTGK